MSKNENTLLKPEDLPEEPTQFGLRGLLVLQAAFALFVAMLVATGIWALLPLFFGTILLRWGPLRVKSPGPRRLVFDMLAGVVLPVLCLVYDPGILRGRLDMYVYVFLAFQIVVLPIWKGFYAFTGRRSPIASGFLATGALLTMVIGCYMAMALPDLLPSSRGLSILMLTPLLMMSALIDNSVTALGPWHEGQGKRWRRAVRFWIGVCLAISPG
ncbi:MAG: hypothetical protein JW818_15725 [Pirellulales bacterium]|nr:hypothetical protein [Pirellulales bacterium]